VASIIQRIRSKIQHGLYVITRHAYLEMEEDQLELDDVKRALFNGKVQRREVDFRGTLYIIAEKSRGQAIGVVGRFAENNRFLIITVYKILGDYTYV